VNGTADKGEVVSGTEQTDMSFSAAVMLSVINAVVVWMLLLFAGGLTPQ